MWKFVTLTILVFLRNAVCELDQDVPPSPLVEIDDNGHADTLKYNGDEKIPIGSIVKCGMDLSEPLRINHIEGGLVGMDYSLDDVVVSNFSKCAVKSLKMDLDSLDMNIYLDCPHLSMFGKYNVTGMIIAIAFEGLGETRVDAENYGLSIKGKLEEFIGEDDQKHVKVKNFIPKSHYGGKVVYNLTNLFYGNEVLATEAHRYINGNWKAVSEFGQAPLMSAVLRPFFKNINKCLKPIPVQHIEF